ncbi:MAG: Gfo/Idh/MocA family protein [Candidatus Brocadiia bacterium]
MVRLAIVGIGGYGWDLARLILGLSEKLGCRLVAAADPRFAELPERASQLREAGAELFADAAAMFDALRDRCEGVYIATGIPSHAPLAIAAFEAGYHVHLEKPPAATVQEVDAMVRAARAAGRMCLVGFQALHSRDIHFLKERAVWERLRPVRSIVCHAGWPRSRAYYGRNAWAGRLRRGTAWVLDGPATNALSHQVVNMLFLAGAEASRLAEPAAVRAELYAAGPVEAHDTAAIEIRTADGPPVVFLGTHCSERQFGPVIDLRAEAGAATWEMGRGAVVRYADGSQERCEADPCGGREAMVANFVEALRADDASLLRCPLAATRPFVLALDAAHESSGRIHRIAASHAGTQEPDAGDGRTVVEGIDELLVECAERRCLFSDLDGAPPWAVATEPYALDGDYRFPQRFRPA